MYEAEVVRWLAVDTFAMYEEDKGLDGESIAVLLCQRGIEEGGLPSHPSRDAEQNPG
jgi:hypothetical protein